MLHNAPGVSSTLVALLKEERDRERDREKERKRENERDNTTAPLHIEARQSSTHKIADKFMRVTSTGMVLVQRSMLQRITYHLSFDVQMYSVSPIVKYSKKKLGTCGLQLFNEKCF